MKIREVDGAGMVKYLKEVERIKKEKPRGFVARLFDWLFGRP